jgi:hypothetical protein
MTPKKSTKYKMKGFVVKLKTLEVNSIAKSPKIIATRNCDKFAINENTVIFQRLLLS